MTLRYCLLSKQHECKMIEVLMFYSTAILLTRESFHSNLSRLVFCDKAKAFIHRLCLQISKLQISVLVPEQGYSILSSKVIL